MSWLNKYNGLTYSPSQDGGFCLYCYFGQCERSVKELGILVNRPHRPLTNLKNAIEKLNKHFAIKP